MKLFSILLAGALTVASAEQKPGNPLDHLPKNIEILTHFGERADLSPDGQRVAFMGKSFGDAFVIDLKTRQIRCLTANVPGAAFLRVMHLCTGDYLLIGPERFKDTRTSRYVENELWFLSQKPGSKPIRLHQIMNEGAAVSKTSLKLSFSQTHEANPALAPGVSELITAELDLSGPEPRLVNKQVIYTEKDPAYWVESQDFYDHDTKLTFSRYEEAAHSSYVMSIDLKTGVVTDMTQFPKSYSEPEGIFPDGKFTMVEANRHAKLPDGTYGVACFDLYKLRLDGTGKDFTRLTHFNDYQGFKATNPVISNDAKMMVFQLGKTADLAGVGYGLMIYHFD